MRRYHNIAAFSPIGDHLAYSSPDGCLKIWETATSILKQEYTPSSHLSATCSTLSWGPSKRNPNVPKKSKKLKSDALTSIENLQFIAMGTMTGDVLLYSFRNAELYSCLTNGHTNVVNDLCWCTSTKSLYTCSNDQHIIVWDVISGKIRTKWKADKVAIHSICVIDENNILSASSSISWWDIKQKSVIKSFSGHATEIFQLLRVKVDDSTNSYFISAAVGDRVISAWQLNENNTKRSVASFVSSGEPGNVDVMVEENEPFRMSVVTKDGTFHLFEHFLNGKSKKPLQPKFSIQIASKATDTSAKAQSVPILAASMSGGFDSCILMYGNFLRPVFERFNLSEVSKNMVLVRDLSFSSPISIEDSITRIKQPEKPSDVKMLAPGHMTDVTLSESTLKKRKQKDVDTNELPMEELLKALDLSKIPKNLSLEEPAIKTDSMVHLLLQGLQSKDNDMLNTVLQRGDDTLIRNTLERLPLQSILLLLKELYKRLNKQEPRHHPALKWLNGLLALHLPYLMSVKDIEEYLGPISQLIEARVENFCKMSQLRGCLKIVMSQAAAHSSTDIADWPSEPLVEYISESSDDSSDDEIEVSENNSDDEEENVLPHDESEASESESEMEEGT